LASDGVRLYKAKLSLSEAHFPSVADYGDSMVEAGYQSSGDSNFGDLPILALLKGLDGSCCDASSFCFFPSLGTWLRRPTQAT